MASDLNDPNDYVSIFRNYYHDLALNIFKVLLKERKMTGDRIALILILCIMSSPVSGQNVDCSVIKNNPKSLQRCLDGQREAERYQKEANRHNKRADLRDKICVADRHGSNVAALAAGWKGRVVYEGTRAASDAISNGASRCPR